MRPRSPRARPCKPVLEPPRRCPRRCRRVDKRSAVHRSKRSPHHRGTPLQRPRRLPKGPQGRRQGQQGQTPRPHPKGHPERPIGARRDRRGLHDPTANPSPTRSSATTKTSRSTRTSTTTCAARSCPMSPTPGSTTARPRSATRSPSPGTSTDPSWPRYIRITDIESPRSLKPNTFKSLPPEVARAALVEEGDLLLAAVGATVGKGYFHWKAEGAACYAGYLVRVQPSDDVDGRFLAYWTESTHYWDQIRAGLIQSTIENFSAGKYRQLLAPTPPRQDQRLIADFLDRKTAAIDALIEKKERLIALLQEKRQALITQAVSPSSRPPSPSPGPSSRRSTARRWTGCSSMPWRRRWTASACSVLRRGFKFHGQLIRLGLFSARQSFEPGGLGLYQQNRLRVVRQLRYDPKTDASWTWRCSSTAAHRHGGAEEPHDRPAGRSRQAAVPPRPGPEGADLPLQGAGAGALRRRPGRRLDDHPAHRRLDPLPAVQPRLRGRRRATPPYRASTAPATSGRPSGSGTTCWTWWAGSSTCKSPRTRTRTPARSRPRRR
jgi:hypothetical protein